MQIFVSHISNPEWSEIRRGFFTIAFYIRFRRNR